MEYIFTFIMNRSILLFLCNTRIHCKHVNAIPSAVIQTSEMCRLFLPFSCASFNHLNVLFQTAKGPSKSQDFEATNQRSFKCLLDLEWVSTYGDIFILINPSCLLKGVLFY